MSAIMKQNKWAETKLRNDMQAGWIARMICLCRHDGSNWIGSSKKNMPKMIAMLGLVLWSAQALAVWDLTAEDIVADFDTSVEVCKDILDQKEIALRIETFERKLSQYKEINLARTRSSPLYKKARENSLTYFSSLSPDDRDRVCKKSWF